MMKVLCVSVSLPRKEGIIVVLNLWDCCENEVSASHAKHPGQYVLWSKDYINVSCFFFSYSVPLAAVSGRAS